ncbi:hypothetical protein Hanom_Chr09g00856701 [Helianthus anomalus]
MTCTTMSAPSARAFWFKGVANVPSMQTKAPLAWHSFETSSMSTHLRNGLVGDSVKKRLTCDIKQRVNIYSFFYKLHIGYKVGFKFLLLPTLWLSSADLSPAISAGSMTDACIPKQIEHLKMCI